MMYGKCDAVALVCVYLHNQISVIIVVDVVWISMIGMEAFHFPHSVSILRTNDFKNSAFQVLQ